METDTKSIMARFDSKGLLWDRRDIEKLILTLVEERDTLLKSKQCQCE